MSLAVFLAACSNSPITSHSTGFWDHYIIYNCSRFIIWLSNNFGGYGMGIIIFTIIVRIIILPLMVYQTKMSVKMQELTPQLKEIQKKLRITMIYVTHDQEEAFALSDRIMVLNDLRIAQLDTPYNLYHNPSDPFVKRFIVDHLDLKVRSIETSISEDKKA